MFKILTEADRLRVLWLAQDCDEHTNKCGYKILNTRVCVTKQGLSGQAEPLRGRNGQGLHVM